MTTDIQRAQEALQYIDPYDRESWVKTTMALKSEFGEVVRDIWEHWSSQAENYSPSDAATVWRSCKTGAITIATLFYIAKQNGWQPRTPVQIDPTEIASRKLTIELQHHQTEADRLIRQQRAAIKAQRLWSQLDEANANHTYLRTKQIKPLNIRELNGSLVIPLTHQNSLVSLQFIQPDGSKRFLKNGQVTGASMPIGCLGDVFYIAEGFATGATINQITGQGVLCAMNAGNLTPVAQQARADYPNAHIIIAADNDNRAKVNTGKLKAYEAARAVGAEVLIPEFPDGAVGSDWNDLYLIEHGCVKL